METINGKTLDPLVIGGRLLVKARCKTMEDAHKVAAAFLDAGRACSFDPPEEGGCVVTVEAKDKELLRTVLGYDDYRMEHRRGKLGL